VSRARLRRELERLKAHLGSLLCKTCEARPFEKSVWGAASGVLWGKELEEALAEEERQERERPKRCPECGKSWEPLVIEAWSPEEAREKAQERSSQ
jgi:hypothetical protein